MNNSKPENEDSFNIVKKNRQRLEPSESERLLPFTWQEHAYERLKVLYGVGKLLSLTNDIEKTFPEILTLCADTFPFFTAIIIENREEQFKMIVWSSESASSERINSAINNAKESFIYLTNASSEKSNEIRNTKIRSRQLKGIHVEQNALTTKKENYCVLPLLVDQLPAYGIFQLEGALPLVEKDLEFIGALADLISISIDRYYKTRFEQELREKETEKDLLNLSRSQAHVLDLEAERELRERFVSLLSHDLRMPLTSIKMSAGLIQRHVEDANLVKSYAHRINNSVDRADHMITDLLDANRIRSGEKLPLQIKKFELIHLVKKTLAELSNVHGDRFVLHADEVIDGYWDPKGIRRIIENLCNNAVKYGALDRKISITVKVKANEVVIEVHNEGNVISREDQKFLFQQFRRGRKTSESGWGIGLTLVRAVAEAHGGTAKVMSEKKSGTIFTVTLPIDSRGR